ncbi:MAG: IclR family transcriptional regulator [Egibacteraceae bacterium]
MGSKAVTRRTLGSVDKAALLLDLLSVGPAYQQLTELAKRSDLATPTVHRTLQSLLSAGLVEQSPDSSRYSLGPGLVRLSQRYLIRLPVVQAVAPYLVELRNATKATTKIALLEHGWVVYVDHIDGENVGMYRALHRSRPAFETAAGRILLAHATLDAWEEAIAAAVAEGPPHRGIDPQDYQGYTQEDRAAWARSPYLVLDEPQALGFGEVAVPVIDQRDRVLASLSASDRHEAFTDETLTDLIVPQLLRAAYAVGQAVVPP